VQIPETAGTTRVVELLAACSLPRSEARALLAAVVGTRREFLVAHPDLRVVAPDAHRFRALAARRSTGTPMAYLLQRQEFYGRAFEVSPAVLVPRPETELLVDIAREALSGRGPVRVLDLGTGSGCIAITLALEMPGAQVIGVDRSTDALRVARANAAALGASVTWTASDWYADLPADARFDAIVANPPYIADDDPHLTALRDEPQDALVAGPDGLRDIRLVVAGAGVRMRPCGLLAVEHGADQGAAARQLMAAAGFDDVDTRRDAAGLERVAIGRWRAREGAK